MISTTESKKLTANALGGKTARACDSCLRKRARWFCAADDAFLCQACDSSVHSANQLASRHERVRLQTASSSTCSSITARGTSLQPSWHQGFNRKARTPRTHNKLKLKEVDNHPLPPLVPEIGNEELDEQEANTGLLHEDDQFLYRVPEFNPFAVELCDMLTSNGLEGVDWVVSGIGNEEMIIKDVLGVDDYSKDEDLCHDQLGILGSDIDISEFGGVDIESLLGLHESSPLVKEEAFDQAFLVTKEELVWDFECDKSPRVTRVVEEEKDGMVVEAGVDIGMSNGEVDKNEIKRSVSLRLNYEAVISAWASQGSPWISGCRPEFKMDDCWPDSMATCPKHGTSPIGGPMRGGDREARVMRYKEKRRTRLFSKKIRYEVRKLNAEKRPRMKGRFVKRTSFTGTSFPSYFPS